MSTDYICSQKEQWLSTLYQLQGRYRGGRKSQIGASIINKCEPEEKSHEKTCRNRWVTCKLLGERVLFYGVATFSLHHLIKLIPLELLDPSPTLTPLQMAVGGILKQEHHTATTGLALSLTPAWLCVPSPPTQLLSLPQAWTMQRPSSSAAKGVSLTAPPSVCAMSREVKREGVRGPAALIPSALGGSGASCYSWCAGDAAGGVCVFVCLCVIGAASHLDKKKHLLLYPHAHFPSKDENRQPPAVPRDLFHYLIFRASNIWGLPCERTSAVQQCKIKKIYINLLPASNFLSTFGSKWCLIITHSDFW